MTQDDFRLALRARTRPLAEHDEDDGWTPHPPWGWTAPQVERTHGPPPMDNPSPAVLAVRRYRERQRAQRTK
jgi:hypothetical protein